jgi:hypothetical protein
MRVLEGGKEKKDDQRNKYLNMIKAICKSWEYSSMVEYLASMYFK